jgi:hypothetical protein
MANDLTTSKTDRQNILNNAVAVAELQKSLQIDCVFFEDKLYFTKEMIAKFFDVDVRTIERYISAFADELKENGYEVLKAKRLRDFLSVYKAHFGTDINVGTKTTVLSVFDFRAFLNMAMLLIESENASFIALQMGINDWRLHYLHNSF